MPIWTVSGGYQFLKNNPNVKFGQLVVHISSVNSELGSNPDPLKESTQTNETPRRGSYGNHSGDKYDIESASYYVEWI